MTVIYNKTNLKTFIVNRIQKKGHYSCHSIINQFFFYQQIISHAINSGFEPATLSENFYRQKIYDLNFELFFFLLILI